MLFFFHVVFFFVFLLLGIAYLTVFERHLLGLSQLRKGPGKVTFMGFFQAFLDGLKLIFKEVIISYYVSKFYFFFMPFLMFFIMFLNWLVFPYFFFFMNFEMSFLFFFCLLGFHVYTSLLSGVFSKSKYSVLGAIRASSQSISFEVVFFFFLYGFMYLSQSFKVIPLFNVLFLLVLPLMFFMSLVELSRPPFDFSEGESELVSGYHIEMGGFIFVLVFLSEYGFMLFFSVYISYLFFYGYGFFMFFVLFLMLLVRSAFPRYRYDKLMGFFWIILVPLTMVLFFFFYMCFTLF